MKNFLKTLTLLITLGTVSACASEPRQIFPEVTFAHQPGIQMSISDVTIERRYVSSLTAPNAEQRMPISPLSVMERWPDDRLVQTGGNSTAKYIIVEASVLEHALDTDGNITAVFTDEQALRYEATAEAIIEVSGNDGLSQGNISARVTRSVTIPEKATLNEREKTQFDLISALMRDFDSQMEQKVRAHLGTWLP